MHHTIQLIETIHTKEFSHIFCEILGEKDILRLGRFGFSDDILSYARKNLKEKSNHRKTLVSSLVSLGNIEKLTLFFPHKKTLIDERSEHFRSLENKTIVVVGEDVEGAYESLFLAPYKYQEYLSEKIKRVFGLFVSKKETKTLLCKKSLYEAIVWSRDRINMPPKDANPASIVEEMSKFPWKNYRVRIFDKDSLKKLGCNLLLAVASGSDLPPYMLIIEPTNIEKKNLFALVGKGVTFDAGGLQIKPDTSMLDMKCDMSGAAAVLGVAQYLDSVENPPQNVIFAVGLTENMTGGKAYRPLDIYTAYNGKTVEIHHTDAEGRLVLADVMSYVEQTYSPKHIITIATLTGACIQALGNDIAGIMGDDEEIIEILLSSTSPYEKVWRLPLTDKFKKSLRADIADLKNIARAEKAGSSLGGAFLSYFQGDALLTHLDIAGPAYRESPLGYMPKGGTGWGVRLLSELLLSFPQQGFKK